MLPRMVKVGYKQLQLIYVRALPVPLPGLLSPLSMGAFPFFFHHPSP